MAENIPATVARRTKEGAYFDASKIKQQEPQYVCWLDVMGARSIMLRSLNIATNFVMKLHIACLEARREEQLAVDLFPIVDGVYICSGNKQPLLSLLKGTLTKLAIGFVLEKNSVHRFLVRGAVAYGLVSKGAHAAEASNTLRNDPDYTNRIVLGMPLVQAYQEEKLASLFGIYLHETARAFSAPTERPMTGTHWRWWYGKTEEEMALKTSLKSSIEEYYRWAKMHSTDILYDKDRMNHHLMLVNEYFEDL